MLMFVVVCIDDNQSFKCGDEESLHFPRLLLSTAFWLRLHSTCFPPRYYTERAHLLSEDPLEGSM